MPPMLKFVYAKFGVSNLFFSKVIEEKPFGEGVELTLGNKPIWC